MSGDSTSAAISMREGLPKVKLATRTTTNEMMATTTMGAGTAMLCSSAMGRTRRGMLEKESTEGRHRKAGDVEEEGVTMIRIPTADNNDYRNALLGIEEGVKGATIAPTIMPHPDVLVIMHHHPIPIPRLTSRYPPPRLIHHDDDLTSPVFDIGEHSGEDTHSLDDHALHAL
ncbi:hypothetical protein EV421DRAFT_1739841 [Armillaria borealis]|uniref:Uncharacterized protein n=1 Tax=Armillaria borealis TaxID=47425 RepID=A0AA39J828_9AGAR|nr:hypothetical protein EV421DRAFT_1739841 [Armillaria borealis]